jgi:tetratricopeptide (TPR) repeat protein
MLLRMFAHGFRLQSLGVTLLLGAVLASAGFWVWTLPRLNIDEELDRARDAFRSQDYRSAAAIASEVLAVSPGHPAAILMAGGAEAASRRPVEAWEFYRHLPPPTTTELAAANCVAAHLRFFDLHHPSDAERLYRSVLEFDPRNAAANSGLANLLGLTGRRWEAIPPTLTLIRRGQCTTNQLILIGSESGGHEDAELLTRCTTTSPQDAIAALGRAWQLRHQGNSAAAPQWVESALRNDPSLISAHVLKGTLLVETRGSAAAVRAWHAALPAEVDEHPEAWLARGQFAQRSGADDVAARCFWETLRLNPNYRVALFQLSQWLIRQGEAQKAQPFVDRSANLQRLKEVEAALFEGIQESTVPIQRVAECLEALGRDWEAWGWCQQARQIDPQASWPEGMIRRLTERITPETPLTARSFNPAVQVDLSDLPWTPEVIGREVPAEDSGSGTPAAPSIRFQNDAAATGLDFTYFNSANPREPGQRMFEFSGGGVAGFDYDLDGWCDLLFTQGCQWPPDPHRSDHVDRLYRNSARGGFSDVTVSSRLREPSFSQGLATGDYDNDGFPDVYIANIGRNQLFRNLGDGTFEETTSRLPDDPGRWTTSVAVADLNGDTWPDIYATNYLEGPRLFERICQHKDGVARMCAPFDFPGSQDQLLLNQGDGTFVDATSTSGVEVPHGKGLGVLVADFEQRGRLDVFVANDLVPNFFFGNVANQRGDPPRFEERGLLNGVAFNADGQAQGCMGMAADDWDGDQRLDVLITNFYMETNVLYLQTSNGVFLDATRESGLAGPSLTVLGFGAQSVDADLDGLRDLVVTNGHVDDHRAYGQPYAMPAQFFRGLGDARFEELAARSVGPFFEELRLGRGMARLDWNGDGREDLAISHLESPAALLTNSTPATGTPLVIQLRGVSVDRDAIGTHVSLTTSAGKQTRQITAGDGYQANNQRQLVFGLGADTRAATLEILWPNGTRQVFENVPGNQQWFVCEGRDQLLSLGALAASPLVASEGHTPSTRTALQRIKPTQSADTRGSSSPRPFHLTRPGQDPGDKS